MLLDCEAADEYVVLGDESADRRHALGSHFDAVGVAGATHLGTKQIYTIGWLVPMRWFLIIPRGHSGFEIRVRGRGCFFPRPRDPSPPPVPLSWRIR